MGDMKDADATTQENAMPAPPAEGAAVTLLENAMPGGPAKETITTMENAMPAPPARDLDGGK